MIITNITLWAGILLALISKAKLDGYYDNDEIHYEIDDEITYNDDMWS